MIGRLIRGVVILVVLVAAAAFLLGWWGSGRVRPAEEPRDAVGTTGEVPRPNMPDVDINKDKAREVGAEVGERTAAVADQAKRALSDGSLTAKIKSKMALDDSVKAMDIDVDTQGSTVTLSGVVQDDAQKQKALQLARETAGVTQVVDRLQVRQ